MITYKYTARNSAGERQQGLKQAERKNDVLNWLREQESVPISISEISIKAKKVRKKTYRKRVKSAELATLCWQLCAMMEGGVSITSALETISTDTDNVYLRKVLKQIWGDIHQGENISDSIAKFPEVFNNLFCAMIVAGETSGNLPLALQKLATHFENCDKLSKKIKGALAYPIFIFVFITLLIVFIMTFIIPRFTVIFDQFGGELPVFTRGFMGFYEMVCHNIIFIIGTFIVSIIAMVLIYTKSKNGHLLFSKIALMLPLTGNILRQSFVAVFCRTMSTLIASGVSVLEVFDILSAMTNNDIMSNSVKKAKEHIVDGANISAGMTESRFFPNIVIKMVQVGEESGSLPQVLEKTADYYERKVDTTITMVMNLLEPLMIVLVGGIVLVVVLALYLPIFSMSA